MLMPASSEFVTLCQAQVDLLTQSLGAALSVVYVTEEVGEKETKLIPIVAYPEAGVMREEKRSLSLLPTELQGMNPKRRLPAAVGKDGLMLDQWARDEGKGNFLSQQRQIVFPLIHEEVVMGLLVTSRGDRAWNESERSQIEEIAQTIAIACILDQRSQWLEQRFSEQQRLQAQQNDLLHNLLHQLRNPLTALRTFGKLLVKRLGLDEKNREFANNILRESDRIEDLLQQFDRVIDLTDDVNEAPADGFLDNLLTISPVESKVETEKAKNVKQPLLLLPESGLMEIPSLSACSLVKVLDSVLAAAFAIAQERNLTFKAEIPNSLPVIKCDSKALTEVLSNIIDNALKYTPSGGKVFVEIKRKNTGDGKFLGVAVSDNGLGIPKQDLEHLFERGFRGVKEKTEIPGTGLGLAIAKELVQQMQGEIEVFSPAKHPEIKKLGTTFIVWLPEFSE
ncbi:GAF domain-containing sensor histidine kinase [Phormidium sp. LEGE 05292]|uniref:sensor histidine kinase n=1 Tax=[Phormidium] sp. LEGE 05292 TaxID=767427 RepID=UPI00187DE6D6|nr:GAF domain-containing sensor histidine kinase [Phormidium sp. LEGE 05292]MBE9224191.1 GAF domain-containing sensor histidine kinase [Phormidium sp. LEGE 05292]